jgi:putative ABC transport system permease protein
LNGSGSHQPIVIEGRPVTQMSEQPEVDVRLISPGYIQSLRVPLRKGREFNAADAADRPSVALISETLAQRFWPNQDPIGKHLTLTFYPERPKQIIGVVGDRKAGWAGCGRAGCHLVRSPQPAFRFCHGRLELFPDVAGRARHLAPNQPSFRSNQRHPRGRPADAHHRCLHHGGGHDRFHVPAPFQHVLFAAFAGLAVLLAAVGIYSVLAYTVRRRVREIGIRMALGAQISDVLRMVMVEGMTPTLIGMATGVTGALALGRVLSSLIYGVQASDPVTFLAVSALLAAVALLASLIPGYRATRIAPIQALREE